MIELNISRYGKNIIKLYIIKYTALFIKTLSHKDSNLERLNQNQLCYHYTMRQSLCLKSSAKVYEFY